MEVRKDEIVEEVRARRDTYARRFNYEVKAICQDLKARQEANGRKIVRINSLEKVEGRQSRKEE